MRESYDVRFSRKRANRGKSIEKKKYYKEISIFTLIYICLLLY